MEILKNVIIILTMKKFFVYFLSYILLSCNTCFSQDGYKLSAGISIDEVPKALYGSWRVVAKLSETDNYATFKPQSVDMWTLSRVGNQITLSNPFSGANATISLQTVEGNLVVFSKKSPYGDKMLTDTISLRLNDNTFSGINTLLLESFSHVDKHSLSKERATYLIKGEKISGDSVLKE